jgi:hypothetical protein
MRGRPIDSILEMWLETHVLYGLRHGDGCEGTHMRANQTNWRIAAGMTVYAMDGDKVGTVRNYGPLAGYLDIQQGWLFTKDFYVGLAEIYKVDQDGITLRLTKDELDDDRFASPPPTGHVTSGAGFVITEKEPIDVEDEEVPETRASGMPVY